MRMSFVVSGGVDGSYERELSDFAQKCRSV